MFLDTVNVFCIEDKCEFIKVDKIKINFKIDTGAEANLIPFSIFKKLNKKFTTTKTVLEAYGGSKIIPLGVCSLMCEHSLYTNFLF